MSTVTDSESNSLYAKYVKVQPKDVKGTFRRLKWTALIVLLAIYYITPWIRWDRGPNSPDQAVLLSIADRKFFFFFIEIWPQQIYFLTGFLVFCAFGLFLATALAGRLWCGYACPQTVWTDLYLWVERLVEGDRGERIRLDNSPWTTRKLAKRLAKHGLWLLIALATGGVWIFYFVDAPTFLSELLHGEASTTTLGFIGLFTASTYLLAGFAREQVCTYMCPWPRFQAAMQDEESLIVTYQDWRGETRAPVSKRQNWEERKAQGIGDCIDCGQCQMVCPTGIDIRNGNQLQCIGCGLCIDACNDVMKRIGRPGNLILFDTENAQIAKAAGQKAAYRPIRPRTIVYGLLLLIVTSLMVIGLVTKPSLHISVLRDRAPLFVQLADGGIQNAYTFKISNMTREDRHYTLAISGVPNATVAALGQDGLRGDRIELTASPDTVETYRIFVVAPAQAVTGASTPIRFTLHEKTAGDTDNYDSVFMGPAK
ncbi:MAG TPA: cytochrome c oxidase accessory protein CcoG [Azospirillaceae bacterium]|nr:cytochrome c oxidase accessory protein CcoG [Azospirillaceae bacterium]